MTAPAPTAPTIETLITRLVQAAPVLAPTDVTALVAALHANGAPLALSIARIVELVADERVDMGIALPALAMACATLVDPRLTAREHEAARYEIDTLQPMPAVPSPLVVPDVPLVALKRRG